MEKKKFLIIGIGTAILVVIILIALLFPQEGLVNIITDKNEYKLGDILKVKIENNSRESICFSSCYPYYFEKESEDWNGYRYEECPEDNLVQICVKPNAIKAFELIIPLPPLQKGIHRLAIPTCVGCNLSEEFKEQERFYSNNFIIKY